MIYRPNGYCNKAGSRILSIMRETKVVDMLEAVNYVKPAKVMSRNFHLHAGKRSQDALVTGLKPCQYRKVDPGGMTYGYSLERNTSASVPPNQSRGSAPHM